jgi:hypothetical protein
LYSQEAYWQTLRRSPVDLLVSILICLPAARIGLATADRPADALAAMGWTPGNWADSVPYLTAVLRSWEDKFGARLFAVGHDEFKRPAERPPRGLHAAQRAAAEVFALGPDEFTCAWDYWALTEVNEIADSLVRSPIWGARASLSLQLAHSIHTLI